MPQRRSQQRSSSSCLLLLLLLRKTVGSLTEHRIRHRHLQDESCDIACHVVRPEVLVEEGDLPKEESTNMIDCIEHRRRRTIPLFFSTIKPFPEEQVEAGTLHLCVSRAVWTDEAELDLSQSTFTTSIQHHRDLQQQGIVLRTGRKTLLAVRVVADGISPQETLTDMEGTIFGTGRQRVDASVVSQYMDMSHGNLQYIPYDNAAVQNGVLEVEMPRLEGVNVQGRFTELLLNRTRDMLLGDNTNVRLEDAVDNIIFCLPNGGLFKGSTEWTAFTYLFEPFSYYQQQRCTRLSVAVHELGHSLGFQHSGVDDNIYADKTGYMGYAVNEVGAPLKTFNAHKHWISGWFQNRQASVNPYQDGARYMRLVGFVDAGDARLQNEDVVVVRVAPYLFLHFNVAKSYNRDTDHPNTITIVEAISDDKVSTRKAELARPGDSYTYVVSETWGTGTVIEICSMVLEPGFVSHAMISVHVEGTDSACDTDVDVWAPNWDEPQATAAPAPTPPAEDFDFFNGTPEDNDGSSTTKQITFRPVAAPIDTLNPTQQTKPNIPLSPWSVPTAAPVSRPQYTPDPNIPGPANDDNGDDGAIDEEEEKSGNAKIIGVSVSGVIGGLLLLGALIGLSVKSEIPLTRTVSKARSTSQGTDVDGSSDKSSNKDQDISETEADNWWGDGWFNFECQTAEENV